MFDSCIPCSLPFDLLVIQKRSQLDSHKDPNDTATVGSAALETMEGDPPSKAVMSVAAHGQVQHGLQGRLAPQDQSSELQQGVSAKDTHSDERTPEAMSPGWRAASQGPQGMWSSTPQQAEHVVVSLILVNGTKFKDG